MLLLTLGHVFKILQIIDLKRKIELNQMSELNIHLHQQGVIDKPLGLRF